jgi:hypothetical protein
VIGEGVVKKYLFLIPLVFFLCFSSSCSRSDKRALNIKVDKGASVIKDAFKLKEDDHVEILEFSLESKDAALVKFSLNGNKLSSRIKKTEAGWQLGEIQDKLKEWTPAENYLMIKGTLKSETGSAIAQQNVTLYEVNFKGGELQASIVVGKGGVLSNPSTMTDAGGNFTIIADRKFWEKSGSFTLGVSLWDGQAYLRNKNGVPLVINVEKSAQKVELGEIKVTR